MQGRDDGQRQLLDVDSLAGHLLEPGSVFAFLAWRIARKVTPDRVISTVDPETRHAHKSREKKQDGFKAHIVIEPDTGLVTAAAVTKASGPANSDSARGIELIAADASIGDQTVEVLADSAYGSGQMLAAITAAGHVPVIKPMPMHRPVGGGFTIDDFTIDQHAATMTCPAGNTRPISGKGRVTFGAVCAACPLRASCTQSPSGRKVKILPYDRLRREHRARAADPEFQATYRQHRPMAERSFLVF